MKVNFSNKKKMVFVTTIPLSFIFFKGQLEYLNNDFEIFAVSSNKKELEKVGKSENVQVWTIPMKRQISLFSDLRSLLKFIRLFLKLKPDIVHGNTPKASFLSMLAAFITQVPVRIYMCHGLRYQGTFGKSKQLLMFMERITSLCATKVFCVSLGVKDTLEKDNITSKARVVLHGSSNGIDLDFFDRKKFAHVSKMNNNFLENDFIFVYVGRLVKDKGLNELLHAFHWLSSKQEYHHFKLLIVGPEERTSISHESRKILESSNKIHRVGFQNDIRPFLAISDVLVLPSYREGFGMVLLEAAAMDVPVIASNIIGCNNIVIDKENGIFINPKDTDSLINGMKLIYEDEELRTQIRIKTRDSVRKRYEQKMLWNAFLEEYKNLEKNV